MEEEGPGFETHSLTIYESTPSAAPHATAASTHLANAQAPPPPSVPASAERALTTGGQASRHQMVPGSSSSALAPSSAPGSSIASGPRSRLARILLAMEVTSEVPFTHFRKTLDFCYQDVQGVSSNGPQPLRRLAFQPLTYSPSRLSRLACAGSAASGCEHAADAGHARARTRADARPPRASRWLRAAYRWRRAIDERRYGWGGPCAVRELGIREGRVRSF